MVNGRDIDYTDDWWNPDETQYCISDWTKDKYPQYIIERAKRVPVTGNVAYVVRWELWSKFDTEEERDKEYERIKKEHPFWRVKKKNILSEHIVQDDKDIIIDELLDFIYKHI